MRRVRAVHGDDVGQTAAVVGAAPVGRDPHAARRVDVIGRMAAIGDRDLFGFASASLRLTGVVRGPRWPSPGIRWAGSCAAADNDRLNHSKNKDNGETAQHGRPGSGDASLCIARFLCALMTLADAAFGINRYRVQNHRENMNVCPN